MAQFEVGGIDYPNWKAIFDHIRGAGGLTENTTLLQIGNTVDNVAFGDYGFSYGGYTLTITQADDAWHKGNPNAGFTSHMNGVQFLWWGDYTGAIIIERLNMITDNARVHWLPNIPTKTIRYNIFRGSKHLGTGSSVWSGQFLNSDYVHFHNNKIFSHKDGLYIFQGGLSSGPYYNRIYIENNTIYNCVRGPYNFIGNHANPASDYNVILRNNVVSDCDTTDWSESAVRPQDLMYNCADSDNTIAGLSATKLASVPNIVAADEFQSLDSANDNFLFLKMGDADLNATATPQRGRRPLRARFNSALALTPGSASLGEAGSSPDIAAVAAIFGVGADNDTDIAGNPRPGIDKFYSIGCHEQQYSQFEGL